MEPDNAEEWDPAIIENYKPGLKIEALKEEIDDESRESCCIPNNINIFTLIRFMEVKKN